MKYYAVAEIDITDRNWVGDYVKNVTRLVERAGGRYLARTSRIEKIEGERSIPQLFLIIEWPSKDAADAFYASDEYRPYRQVALEPIPQRDQRWIFCAIGSTPRRCTARSGAVEGWRWERVRGRRRCQRSGGSRTTCG